MSAELDKDVLATLTDEERAAIEGDELSESEQEALKSIAGDDDDDDDDGDDSGGGAAPIEGKGASDTDADGGGASDEEDAEPAERGFRPTYKAELPEDFDEQLSSLDAEHTGLIDKFKAGDIDFDEYQVQVKDIDQRRYALDKAKTKAELYADMSAQNAEQEWAWTVNRFIKQTAKSEDAIDYAKDEAKRRDLDTFVKALGADEANANRDFDWFLAEAHKRVKALHGIATKAKPAGDNTPGRKPPMDAVPKTLADVPGSDGPGDVADEFADIDSLDGDALELAIAKMTPDQREKYARA